MTGYFCVGKKIDYFRLNFRFYSNNKQAWSEEQEDELRQLYMENQSNPSTEKGICVNYVYGELYYLFANPEVFSSFG